MDTFFKAGIGCFLLYSVRVGDPASVIETLLDVLIDIISSAKCKSPGTNLPRYFQFCDCFHCLLPSSSFSMFITLAKGKTICCKKYQSCLVSWFWAVMSSATVKRD